MAEGGLNIFNAVKADDISLCMDLVDSGQCVNETNEKGEIPLHISMADTISIEITNVLLNAGSDLNAQNILGQTSLHYAVAGENVDKINLLLSNKSLDRHKIDINGYNAFHALIYATNDDSNNWKTKLSILVSSGVDVNSQTNFGNTVLHIACNKFNNIDIVRTLMLLCPTIECRSQNKNGENFLHSFIVR
ncbi:unnamed protein product [Mytilus coruscus]|uniref:Uncharacterized protein n=1 Tax=Mytilus coruscus TaxID=42192 RepID=A0A6J8AJM2_MYTCO|nr:unnamed protein product [Mytilus coruscus]